MPNFDYQAAKKAGATDDQIASFLYQKKSQGINLTIQKGNYESGSISHAGIKDFINDPSIQKEASKSTPRRFLGALPGALAETALKTPAKFITSGAEGAIQSFQGKMPASGKTYNTPFGSFKSYQSDAQDRKTQGQNPVKNIAQGALEVGSGALDTIGAVTGGLEATKALKQGFSSLQDARTIKQAWNMIKPELKGKTIAEAGKAGGLKTTKFGGITQKLPTTGRDAEMLKVATPYVKGAKNELQAVNNLKQGIADSANSARQGLKDSKAIWNENELSGAINKIEMPNSIKSDQVLANNFNNAKSDIMKLAKDAVKTPDGLLDVRQKFDQIMEDDFGPRIWNRTDGVSKVYKSFRTAINDLANSKVTDNALKIELNKQTLLYDAIDNTAPKIKLGNKLVQLTKRYPRTTGAVAAAGAIAGEKLLKKAGVPLP